MLLSFVIAVLYHNVDLRPALGRVGGEAEGFCGVMKYLRHILMGHEIFFKIFDGRQIIILCYIFIILFFKLRKMLHWAVLQNVLFQ